MSKVLWPLFLLALATGLTVACSHYPAGGGDGGGDDGGTVSLVCLASPSWVSDPNPPDDVSANGRNCEFHQFAWRWFLDLASPQEPGSDERRFEDSTKHPILGVDPCPGTEPAIDSVNTLGLGIRTDKDDQSAPFAFHLPKHTGQAGSEDPLYDQNGKVVYYNIRYTYNECDVDPNLLDAAFPNTPPNTVTEMKTAWRQIDAEEADRFFTAEGTIVDANDQQQTLLLGLVGFHLVKNSQNHPEFIWATFEHEDNAPICNPDVAPTPPAAGWSFASRKCAACLATPYSGDCPQTLQDCNFNRFPGGAKATEVCRASQNGGGNLNNQANIESLNAQLVGPAGYLTRLSDDDPMAIFRHYFLVGTLWLRNPTSDLAPWIQDGSTSLASTVMETFEQPALVVGGVDSGLGANCFSCHSFNGTENTATLSHILPIKDAQIVSTD